MIFGKGLVGNKGRFCDSEEHTQLMAKNAKFIPPKSPEVCICEQIQYCTSGEVIILY